MTGRLVYAYGDLCGEGVSIIRYGDVVRFLAPRMSSLHAPSCWALYTDFENNLLYCSTLCESLEWWTPECVRRLVRESASLGARNLFIVVFTGNIAQVLGEDIQDCLLKVACTMKAVDVKLLDCILASDNGFYSMNASGRMDAARNVVMRPSPGESYAAEHPFEPQGDGW